jgi:hypothetical protein
MTYQQLFDQLQAFSEAELERPVRVHAAGEYLFVRCLDEGDPLALDTGIMAVSLEGISE